MTIHKIVRGASTQYIVEHGNLAFRISRKLYIRILAAKNGFRRGVTA